MTVVESGSVTVEGTVVLLSESEVGVTAFVVTASSALSIVQARRMN
jgi:hypothetical protein